VDDILVAILDVPAAAPDPADLPPASAPGRARHRVVIVGCGFGGLFAAKRLRRVDAQVTVLDRTNHHLFQPLLYQLATGILSEGDIAPPIRDVLRRQRNTNVLLGELVAIDADARRLMVELGGSRSQIPYDSLIVATGSRQSYFGHDEFERHAPGLKTIDDALELRGEIFGAFEMAEREQDRQARQRWLTFVVVGAGPTGVEMAGQIAELAHRSLRGNFRAIDPSDARVVLLDGTPTALATFPAKLQEHALDGLRKLGVEVELGTLVTGVDAKGVSTNAEDPALQRIEAATKMWAAGVEGSSAGRMLAQATGVELDRSGRVKTQADCTLPGHPEIFVVGDLMSLDDLPGLAEVAMQSGRHAAETIRRRLAGDDSSRPFRYRDLGTMTTVSRFRAIAVIGPVRAWGLIGWLLWLLVHLTFLTGFKNRVAVLANWTIAFIGSARPQRAITARQVSARERGRSEAVSGE
jgi:NADH dehydrogenase